MWVGVGWVWVGVEDECPDCGGSVEVETREDVARLDLVQADNPARCTEPSCDWVGRVQGDDEGTWLE